MLLKPLPAVVAPLPSVNRHSATGCGNRDLPGLGCPESVWTWPLVSAWLYNCTSPRFPTSPVPAAWSASSPRIRRVRAGRQDRRRLPIGVLLSRIP